MALDKINQLVASIEEILAQDVDSTVSSLTLKTIQTITTKESLVAILETYDEQAYNLLAESLVSCYQFVGRQTAAHIAGYDAAAQ